MSSHNTSMLSTMRPSSPSWSEASSGSDHDEPSSPKRHHSSSSSVHARRGPGGRGGGGNNVSGIKGPRWNEERKALVLQRFLQPFVTRELYRLDLQAALEAFIIEQEWDDVPMKDMVTRIKRLLTNARDINKKKAARGGAAAVGAITAKSCAMAQQKKKDQAIKAASKTKAIAQVKSKKTITSAPAAPVVSTTPPVVIAPVVTIPANIVVKAPVSHTSSSSSSGSSMATRQSGSKPKTVALVDASPVDALSLLAKAVSKVPMVPPPITIPAPVVAPWSPQESVSSHSSSGDSVDESADGDSLFPLINTGANTPVPSSVAAGGVVTPMLSHSLSISSCSSSDDETSSDASGYESLFTDVNVSTLGPLPMLPALPSSLLTPLPTPRIQVPVLSADITSPRHSHVHQHSTSQASVVVDDVMKIEDDNVDVDAVDAAPYPGPLVDAAGIVFTSSYSPSGGLVYNASF